MRFIVFALATCLPLCANGAAPPTFTTLVQFTGTSDTANGWNPTGTLTLSCTTLYGMTSSGGQNIINFNDGNIFSVGTNGTNFQNLISFTGIGGAAPGKDPQGSLTLIGTTLYGMTLSGGSGDGTIFSVGADGTNFQSLVSFQGGSGTPSGINPYGSLTLSGTRLYGMTQRGGTNGFGN